MAKIGPLCTLNSVVLRVVYLGAQEVGGQQVGRELHSREPGVYALRHRLYQQRLGQPGHAFEQDVPVRHQRDEHPVDERVLADYHLPDLSNQAVEESRTLFDLFVHLPHGCQFHLPFSMFSRQVGPRPPRAAGTRLIVQFYDTQ